MRFYLGELLSLPLIFVVIALVLPWIGQRYFLYAPRANWMVAELEELNALANGEKGPALLSSAQEFNEMISDPNSKFDDTFGHHLRLDHWGNPYVCVENDVPFEQRWKFYSNGLDRVSQSNGSDPDDLNSWDLSSEYYVDLDKSNGKRDTYSMAVIWVLPVFALLVCVRRLCYRHHAPIRNENGA